MRNRELDGLRGLAALAVALGHSVTTVSGADVWAKNATDFPDMTWQQIAGRMAHVVFPADAAVVIFFVMSGYVVWASLMHRSSGVWADAIPYVIRRTYRLLPAAIASALLIGALVPTSSVDLVKNAFLLSYNINGVVWSLQVEAVGSLLIFPMFAAVKHSTPWILVAFAAVLISLAFYSPNNVTMFLPAFVFGASIHYLPAAWFRRRSVMIAAYLGVVLADLLIGRGLDSKFVMCCGTLVFVASIINQSVPFLASRPARALGEISYPFYLFSMAGDVVAMQFLTLHGGLPENQIVGFIAFAILSIGFNAPVALLAHVFVERPGMQAGSILANRLAAFHAPKLDEDKPSYAQLPTAATVLDPIGSSSK